MSKVLLTEKQLANAEKAIREDFEDRLKKFLSEIKNEDYGYADDGWDFVMEFAEWSSYQEGQ